VDDAVQWLLDVEEIRALKARYFRLLDAKRWSEWVDVFSDDLEFVYADPSATGRHDHRRRGDGGP
jgi:3-phenylpropionate/cinnamic acid dioxygenase small subunit